MANIQKAIEYAKQNPDTPFAKELRGRIESGKLDSELSSVGLPTSKDVKEKSTVTKVLTDIPSDIKEGFLGVGEQLFKAGEGIVSDATNKNLSFGEKIRGIGSKIFSGIGRAGGEVATTAIKLPFTQEFEEKTTQKVGELATQAINRPEVQQIISTYQNLDEDTKREIQNALGFTEGITAITGTQGLSNVGKKVATNVVNQADDIVKRIQDINIPKPTMPFKGTAKAVKDLGEDIIPTSESLRDTFLAKSLRLAPVEDISNIEQLTGNNIGEFMGRMNLIKDTPTETTEALAKFQNQNFQITRDAIDLIPERFTYEAIPEMKDLIGVLKQDLVKRKSAPYKQALARLEQIEAKNDFDLTDAQYVKELFDDIESVYKRSGEVREAISAQDKAQLVTPIRRFIEDRVQEVYPSIDIRALNNNVQTSRAILDAVIKRSNKADTSSFFQLGDLAVLGVGNAQAPGLGYGALFAKKIIESSPVQLRLSRWLANRAQGKAEKAEDFIKKMTPEDLKEINNLITTELKDAVGVDEIKQAIK